MRDFVRCVPGKCLAALCAVLVAFSLTGCGNTEGASSLPQGDQQVLINVECESNLLFSKYDVDLFINDEYQGTLDHGSTQSFELSLADGTYTLRFAEEGDSSVDGSVEFEVSGNTSLKYIIHCTNSQVEIEEISNLQPPMSSSEVTSRYHDEVHRAFEEAGFTNIQENEVRDLTLEQQSRNWYTEAVTIGESSEFDTEDSFHADDEVVITYHVLADICAPASSSELEGMDYEEVVRQFEGLGFINVSATPTDVSGVAGTVASVKIGGLFGTSSFGSQDTFPFDAGVEVLYVEGGKANSGDGSEEDNEAQAVPQTDLDKLLSSPSTDASWFSSEYRGCVITFDGYVASLIHHEDYKTRWDVLILAGDSGSATATGPYFRITDVALSEMSITNADWLQEGDEISITAVVGDYTSKYDWLEIDPVSTTVR